IAIAALSAGKHVLVEKPMGRSLAEAEQMRAAACAAGRVLKVGFNHRYHPAIAAAWQRVSDGAIGEVINLHCRYGHGGRPGYERGCGSVPHELDAMEKSLLSRGVRSFGGCGGAGAGAELRGGNPHRVPPAAGGRTAGGGNADLRGRGRLLATRVGRLRAGGTGW